MNAPTKNFVFTAFYEAFETCSNAWAEVRKVRNLVAQPSALPNEIPSHSPIRKRRGRPEDRNLRFEVMLESSNIALKSLREFAESFFKGYMSKVCSVNPDPYSGPLLEIITVAQRQMEEIRELVPQDTFE